MASSGSVYFGFYKPWSPGVRWGHYWAVEFFTNDFTPQSLNIPQGLKRLWKRLNERYGAPILVEGSTRLKLAKIPWKLERGYQRLFDLLSILMELQWRRRTPVLLHAVLSGLHSRHKDNHYRSTIFFFKNIGQIVYWYIKKQTTLLSFHSTFLWTMLRRWAGQRTTIVSCKMVEVTHGVEKQPSKTFRVINFKETTVCQQIDKENFNECITEVLVCVIHKGPDV